jgi:hypothetical protein
VKIRKIGISGQYGKEGHENRSINKKLGPAACTIIPAMWKLKHK